MPVMKNVEKELTGKNLKNYEKDGFITREEVISRTSSSVIVESKTISKLYHRIDWKKVFSDDIVLKRTSDTNDYINYIIIKDKNLGVFRINDMGENYILFCKSSWTDKDRSDLIKKLNEHGIVCDLLNKNLINIKKQEL